MESEGFNGLFTEAHAASRAEVLGSIRAKLIAGSYDMMRNGHQDEIVISDGEREYVHLLTRDEAQRLEEAEWSAGEDLTLDGLMHRLTRESDAAGIKLVGTALDITIRLRPKPEN